MADDPLHKTTEASARALEGKIQVPPDAPAELPVRFARHSGMERGYPVQPLPPEFVAEHAAARSRRERQILGHMLAVQEWYGRLMMVTRGSMRASDQTMHDLFYCGLVNGCGSPDSRGSGNTPQSSWWWLTERGEQIARACGLPPKGSK
jgi:hypothetical protein